MHPFIAAHKANHRHPSTQRGGGVNPSKTGNYAVFEAMIESDENYLKATYEDHIERNKHKPVKLKQYKTYLEKLLHSGDQSPNKVLVKCAIWAADAGQYEWAITLADFGLAMPTPYKRNLPTLVADIILQESTVLEKQKVFERIQSNLWGLNHPLRAKYYKFFAQHLQKSDPHTALLYAETAHKTYKNVAVKGLIEQLNRAVKNTAK